MALSQVQCLDNNHINLRTNESKPEFLYSEEQRLALEKLIRDGQDAFEDYIKINNIRCFLSDLELERILDFVEVYNPGSPDNNAELYGESDGEEVSLQYWPDRSDRSIPQLDIGWPDRASYRGVTRVQVYTQPPYEGQTHIKEVVRKMIGQAQRVIAVVMDLFTDIDIFRDLLDASYRRKVAVYIMLESTGVKHFMRMCEKADMHTGHLKNLRVRSIRGTEFFSRSSKRVCGNQSQKFMFIDGDKAVAGSYSFTWSASRLDRNLITVLTGQVVDTFDTLFQDMYVMSNGVCLSKTNLSSEPEPEYLPQTVPTPLPSPTRALKLINPKYTLVSNCVFTTNGPEADQTSAKNQMDVIKQIKDTPVVPPVHQGLINLEKVNMINYVPTWPDPEPQSDVIGFINIRDSNKPLQAHLMRSELFGISQAIRFKDSPIESLPLVDGPRTICQTPGDPEAQKQPSGEAHFDQNQNKTNLGGDLILLSEKLNPVHMLACNKEHKEELCVIEKELDSLSLQSKSIHTKNDFTNAVSDDAVSDTKPNLALLQPLKGISQTSDEFHSKPSTLPKKTHLNSFASPEKLNQDQVITDVASQDHRDAKPEINVNGLNSTQMNCDSSISTLSDEYFECFSPVADLRSAENVFVSEKTPKYVHNQIKKGHQEQEVLRSNSGTAENCTDLGDKQNFFTPKLLKTSCSIAFNFLSAEAKTATAPSKTPSAQESDKDKINDDSKLPVNDNETSYFSQARNSCFNLSSPSEEYFECSDTVGLKSETDCMVKKPSSVDNVKLNEPLQIPKPILEAELSCQNMEERDESNVHYRQKQPEFEVLKLTEEFKAVSESENTIQSEPKETVHSHQAQDSKVTSEPEVGRESMSDILQKSKISASQHFSEKQTVAESVALAEKVPMPDLQIKGSLGFTCVEPENESLQDLTEHDSNLYLISENKSVQLAKKNLKLKLQDIQFFNGDVVCEGQSLQSTQSQKAAKPSLQDTQSEDSPDVLIKPSEVNAIPQSVTDSESRSSILQDKANVTPIIAKMSKVNKAIELHNSEELPNPVTSLDSGSNQPPNFACKDNLNEVLRLQNNGVCPAVLERTSDEHNLQKKLPEEFINIELLIVEDSDLQETELKLSDSLKPRAILSKETKLSKNKPAERTIDRKSEENKLGHNVYSGNEKETDYKTAVVEKKQEEEHICTNQINKNLPEAKPKLTRKQPHQATSRIPIQAKRGLTKLPISKPDPNNRSFGLQSPKAGMHKHPLGKPQGQNKPSITSSPSPEKLSPGGISPVRSTQIPQRPTWTLPAPNSPTSPHNPTQIQLVAPRIRQSEQPNVTRKRSASITKYNCSSSGISCPGQVKKQAFKGPPANN